MTNEKRANQLWAIACKYTVTTEDAKSLLRDLEAITATVRADEREAAFKILCSECAEGNAPRFDHHSRWFYHKWGEGEIGCSASKLRIAPLESANRKGEV